MSVDVRLSHQTLKVLRAFMARPRDQLSGAEIARETHLMSGTLYPILARLEKAGWLESAWEEVDARVAGRPRRRLYRITSAGQNLTLAAFADLGLSVGGFAWTS